MANNTKVKKVMMFIIMVLIFGLCMGITSNVMATSIIIGKDPIKPSLMETEYTGNLKDIISTALGFVQFFSWGVAMGMMVYVGIKYMTSAANEKADLKNSSIKYVMGAIIIGAASTLMSMVWDIAYQAYQISGSK